MEYTQIMDIGFINNDGTFNDPIPIYIRTCDVRDSRRVVEMLSRNFSEHQQMERQKNGQRY